MRIIFLGSSGFSCSCLSRLLSAYHHVDKGEESVSVVGVVTQPDRPRGRRLALSPSPVKILAEKAGLPVLTPAHVNAPETVTELCALRPDLIIVVAYGQILQRAILELPPLGCVNVHASLLPRYRGAAPVQWAIAQGETVTGVTTLFMTPRLDAGDILDQVEVPIAPDDTAGTLQERLSDVGADLLVRTLEAIRRGQAIRHPQDERLATYAPKLGKEDGRLDWTWPADVLHNRVRGFTPWPGCYCKRRGMRLKVVRTAYEQADGPPGTVLDPGPPAPLVATGRGALRLLHVQPEGKRVMTAEEYIRGHPFILGEVLT